MAVSMDYGDYFISDAMQAWVVSNNKCFSVGSDNRTMICMSNVDSHLISSVVGCLSKQELKKKTYGTQGLPR